MELPVRPDLPLGNYLFSWEKASYRVLLTGDQDLANKTYNRLKSCFERYAQKNDVMLLISDGEKFCLHGNSRCRQSFETYVSRCVLDVPGSLEDEMACVRDLLGSLIILIGPETFTLNVESNDNKCGAFKRNTVPSLWRRARVLSFASFAVLPDRVPPFSEINDAFTKIRLVRQSHDLSQYIVTTDSPHISVKMISLFPDVMAVVREILITPSLF